MEAEFGLRLRATPTNSYRRFTLIWRSIVVVFAAVALGLEVSIVSSIYDARFPASQRFMSTLPTGGLIGHIIWNFIAITTVASVKPFMHSVGDLFALVSLMVMGYIGFNYDDIHYLRNGLWRTYETPSFLPIEIAAAVLMITIALLQTVLVFVTAFTYTFRDRYVSQPDIYTYGPEEPIEEGKVVRFEHDEERLSVSKTSLNSIAKTKSRKE